MNIIKTLYNAIIKWQNSHFCDTFECSIGDVLLLRDIPRANQILLTSRLLDVEAYMSGFNKNFPYQNAISYSVYGEKHYEQRGNDHFRNLIESYSKDGYRPDSFITCDKNMMLMDGNHRMGLNIYYRIEKVLVRRIHKCVPFQYGCDWYYQVGLSSEIMNRIFKKYYEIQSWLIESGNTFCMLIKNNANQHIIDDLSHLCSVLKIRPGKEVVLLQFSMPNPDYLVKDNSLVSKRARKIKDIIVGRYGDIVEVSLNCMEGKKLFVDFSQENIL